MEQAIRNLSNKPELLTGKNLHSKEPLQVKCTICGDRGIILSCNAEGLDVAKICKCMEQRKLERLFKASQITPAFQSKTFGNFQLEGRPEAVREMFECASYYTIKFNSLIENNWLVFLGETGSGKTHLSMAVANNLLAKGISTLYFPYVEGMGELKSLLGRSGELSLEDRLYMIKKVDLLIWDDLFKGRIAPTDFEFETTFQIINYRYYNLMPTIISSELNEGTLYNIDKALASRIFERAKGHLVIIEGVESNYRLI